MGRDEELALLDGEARRGPVVVAGPAGVGKSRLVADWVRELDGPTTLVVATRSSATVPFGAFARWAPADLAPAAPLLATLRSLAERLEATTATLAVDDAHLLDDGAAALVLHLAQHTGLRIVATLRTGEPCPDPIAALWRDGVGTRIDLRPLSEAECAELVTTRLGGRLHASAHDRLWTLSGGNPMHLREATESALEQGRLVASDGTWSWTGPLAGSPRLVDLVEARLGRLDDADRRALELIALGEPLALAVVTAVVDPDRVERLEADGLLALADQGGMDVVGLGHPLYGEVLRATTPRLRARAHHEAIGAAAVAHGVHHHDPLRVALWLEQGRASTDDVALLTAASTRAMVLQDYDLSDRLAVAAVAAGGGVAAMVSRARALALMGRTALAAEVLDAAGGAATTDDERAQVAMLRATHAFWDGRGSAPALEVVDAALAELPPRPAVAVAATGAGLALIGLDLPRARELAAAVVAGTDDERLALAAHASDGLARTWQGDGTSVLAEVPELLGGLLPHVADDPLPAATVGTAFQLAMALSGRAAEAEAAMAAMVGPSPTDSEVYLALPLLLAALLTLDQGRLDDAATGALRALELMGEDRPYLFGRPVVAAAVVASARAQAGDAAGARRALAVAERRFDTWIPDPAAHLDRARAWVLGAEGRLPEAAAGALAVAERLRAAGALGLEVGALLDATRLGGATAVADRLARGPTADGPVAGLVGDLARALVDADGPALDDVAERAAALGLLLVAAEAAARASAAHGTAGLRPRQAASRRRAQELRARSGAATPLLAGLDQDPVVAALTAREREVALLAAAGRTNREVAEVLGLSARTVNSHLNHAYAKLGTSDRDELAHLLAPPR